MKKFGILTFHASHNNGSMLQALALQNVLTKKYNCQAEIINFSNPAQQNMYSPLPKADNWKRQIKRIIWWTNKKQMIRQFDAYNAFSKKYFNLSSGFYSHSAQLKDIENDYDAFISGSDQVWNINCTDADDVYYLDFVTKKPRFAYAVSFGANNPFELDGDKTTHKDLVDKFDLVSVREKNAKKWVKEGTGRDVPICLDPTMLYDSDEWEQIVDIGNEPIIKGDYIFYYCFAITEQIQKFLKHISKKYNMPVYFMEAKEWTLKMCWRNGIKLIKEYGPDVYMNVVKHSKMFVTTSFHGTAFATIFKKNFWYINTNPTGEGKDDRAVSFLTQLDLMDRYKTVDELKEIDLTSIHPSFENADQKLKDLRQQSFDFIESMVNFK